MTACETTPDPEVVVETRFVFPPNEFINMCPLEFRGDSIQDVLEAWESKSACDDADKQAIQDWRSRIMESQLERADSV